MDRHQLSCPYGGRRATGRGNVDRVRYFYACSTEFFSYTLLKVKILWDFYSNSSFICSLEPFKRCFQWRSNQNCSYTKLSICGNFRFTRNVVTKGFKLFSCQSLGWTNLRIARTDRNFLGMDNSRIGTDARKFNWGGQIQDGHGQKSK
jgi:hypothetical protein